MCQYLPTGNFVETLVAERAEDKFLKIMLNSKDDHKQ